MRFLAHKKLAHPTTFRLTLFLKLKFTNFSHEYGDIFNYKVSTQF